MADFLVLEEDGTSHVQLEESTDALLLEDNPYKTGAGVAGVRGAGASVAPSTPATLGASYKGGVFTAPGSTGSFSVSGIGFEPQVVLFFGSNKNTYDSVVSAGTSAVMRGTMVWDDTTGQLVSWCSSAVPHSAMRWEQKPIVCCDTSGTTGTDYQANAVSMDSDGFTVNFTAVPGGTRQIHYVAIGNMHRSFAKIIGSHMGGSTQSTNIGFRIETGLELGGLDDTIQDVAGANAEKTAWGHMLTWGGKSFETDNVLAHNSMYVNAIDTPFNDQDDLNVETGTGTTSYIGREGHFGGPFLVPGAVQMTLSGAELKTVTMACGNDNQGHFTGLLVQSNTGSVQTADAGAGFVDVVSTNNDVDQPAMMLFLGAGGREAQQTQANPNAMTFGFWTPDHSYCVAANGNDDSFFQSQTNAWCSKVTAAGAHAGTVTSLAPSSVGARLTTAVAGVTHAKMVWHMFGPPLGMVVWIPQSYRRRN